MGLTHEGAAAKAESEAFVKRFGITWPTGYGAAVTVEALGVAYLPTVFVIAADGKILWNDKLDNGELDDAIDQAISLAEAG